MIKDELYSVPFSVHDQLTKSAPKPAPQPKEADPEGPELIMVGRCKVCKKKMYKPAGMRGRNPKKHKRC